MKMPENKATVDTAKDTKIDNNHQTRNEFCFKKKAFANEKGYYCFLWISSGDWPLLEQTH